jgi:hypothetical protein
MERGRLWMKTLAEISLFLTLALAVVPSMQTAQANPVPYPMIAMPYEYIYANITVADNGASAKVNGTYPFYNHGYPNVSMSYPLPQDSTNVTVGIDGDVAVWKCSEANYSTVLGDLPVINWTVDPAPSEFTVEVDYEHAVPMIGRNFTYFYAMGTWKHLTGLYSKQATAYLTADINMESIEENQTLEVYAYQVVPGTQQWIWEPQNCIISRIGNTFQVSATVISDLFRPIKGDFLLTFRKVPSADVAVSSIVSAKTVLVGGHAVLVSATIQNLGDFPETFKVTVCANTAVINQTQITLAISESTTITFLWNTTDFSYGNYTVSAYAWPVPGETYTANNNFTLTGVVHVTISGDINGDFKVSLSDLVLLANAYGAKPGDAKWNPNADIDSNDAVGLSDLVILAQHYGEHYP